MMIGIYAGLIFIPSIAAQAAVLPHDHPAALYPTKNLLGNLALLHVRPFTRERGERIQIMSNNFSNSRRTCSENDTETLMFRELIAR